MKKITSGGNILIRIITGILAIVFFTYSLFTLWDMYRTEIKAFASYDLLQYRPDIENDEPPYLDELLEINPDTVGWLTIYGTNIDYPIMQGDDDNEYLNKSATGEYLLSGSIFMSVLNHKDFSDPYTLIYGHHMANGSMFGDIDKFKDEKFFYNTDHIRFSEEEGVLIMRERVYNLKVLALMETSAYNEYIYRADKDSLDEFIPYLMANATYHTGKSANKILALSTCDSAMTDGRTVLFCSMELRTDPLPTREEEPLTPHRKAVGHPMAGAYWALMNLICLIFTIFAVLKANINKIRHFGLKNKSTIRVIIVELMVMAVSILLFILTEDLHKPIQIIDAWTLPMIMLVGLVYLIERISEQKHKSEIG